MRSEPAAPARPHNLSARALFGTAHLALDLSGLPFCLRLRCLSTRSTRLSQTHRPGAAGAGRRWPAGSQHLPAWPPSSTRRLQPALVRRVASASGPATREQQQSGLASTSAAAPDSACDSNFQPLTDLPVPTRQFQGWHRRRDRHNPRRPAAPDSCTTMCQARTGILQLFEPQAHPEEPRTT